MTDVTKDVEQQLPGEGDKTKTPRVFTRKRIPQFLAAGAASIGGFSVGASLVWTVYAIESMRERGDFGPVSSDDQVRLETMFAIGALAGCPLAGLCFIGLGRKPTMLLFCLPFLVGWLLMAFSTASTGIVMLFLGRLIAGVGGGGVSMVAPIYISEIATPFGRGNLGTIFMLLLLVGAATTQGIGGLVTWKTLALINAVVPAIMFVCVLFIPESPYFSIAKGKIDEARRNLKWLRKAADEKEIESELNKMTDFWEITSSRAFKSRGFLDRTVWMPTLIGVVLVTFAQIQGLHILHLVEDAALSNNSFMTPGTAPLNLCLPIIFAVFLMDRKNRRNVLIGGKIGTTIALTVLGTFFYFKEQNGGVSPKGVSWLTFIAMLIYFKFYICAIGSVARIVVTEILPTHFKGPSSTIIFMFYWAWTVISIRCFHDLLSSLNHSGFFWLYAIINAVGGICIYYTVPETKGKSLEEIQEEIRRK